MATTTNYGWTTPDDTALVKDGASAIRTLGSSVDTTVKALNPSTTLGDIEYRSSTSNTNTRLAIGTSGQGLQVVAGVPAWAASSTSTLTTTGDTLYASAANTLARLGIGSAGQVLTVSGGVPSWATPSSGAYTLLSTTTLSGTSTTISSISQSYTHLYLYVYGVNINTSSTRFRMAPNAATNLTQEISTNNTPALNISGSDYYYFTGQSANMDSGRTDNAWSLTIFNYTSALRKPFTGSGAYYFGSNVRIEPTFSNGIINDTNAITSLVFSNAAGNTFAAGTILLYGVK